MNENGRKTLCKDEFTNCEIVKENQQLQQELQKYKSLYENEKEQLIQFCIDLIKTIEKCN